MPKLKVLLVALFLTGCLSPETNRYEMINKAKWSKTTIEIHWLPTQQAVSDKCISLGTNDGPEAGPKAYNGCARSKPDDIKICEIYLVEPKNFDDREALEALGHETWHCFGAKHK